MPDAQTNSIDAASEHPSAARGSTAGGTRRELIIGLLLAVVVFVFHYVLEHRLQAMGAFMLFDTLFDADPGLTVQAISSGGGGNHLSHPLFEYFFSIPIGIMAKLGSLVSSGAIDEEAARLSLALFVVPIATGVQTFVALRLLRAIGLSLRSALLLVILGVVSFSSLLLGSMPETYCLSTLCITLAYMLFLKTRDRRDGRAEISWIAMGVLTAGVTITNGAAIAILYFIRERSLGRDIWRGGLRTATAVAIILAITLTAGYVLDEVFDAQPSKTPSELVWISRYFVDDPVVKLVTFPTAVLNGLAPPVPERRLNRFAVKARRAAGKPGAEPIQGTLVPVRLTLQETHDPASERNWIGLVLLAVLACVALRDKQLEPATRSLARASLTIIAFNWILHGFWGGEQFLYSQHWHMSLLVLFAVAVSALETRGRNALVPLGICVLGIAISNSIVLAKTLQALREGWPGF